MRQSRMPVRRGSALQGCLIALAVVVVLIIGVGVFVAMNFKNWVSDGATAALVLAINESDRIPAGEKPDMVAAMESVRDEYKAGNITLEEVGVVVKGFVVNRGFVVAELQHFAQTYVTPSTLAQGDKDALLLALNRVEQGLASGAIDALDASAIFEPIRQPDPSSSVSSSDPNTVEPAAWVAPAAVTVEQYAQMTEAAEKLADDAGVPTTRQAVDISDVFRKDIEEDLGRALPASVPASPAPVS